MSYQIILFITSPFRDNQAMATRQLAAIMFTDMVGYTALMGENEQLALEKRRKNKAIFEECLSKYKGILLQQYGDGMLSINNSAVNAILSAIEMQTLSQKEKIDLRIGLHIGEILTDENGIYGDGVNIASRIESLAVPGSVFISEKLFDEIKNQPNIYTKPLGYFELKNVKQPMQVYAVVNPGIVVPSRDEVKGKLKQTINSIAVLPFTSMSADPENEYFSDGLSEELINVISKVEGIQVSSRTSSFAFKGKQEDIREIAGRLNVQNVIEGSVRKSGNKVRITVQLINAVDGYHIWSESYDRSLEDIFEVQDEISRSIANKLRKNLSSSDHEKPLVTAPTENLEAYKKYLKGLYYWNKQTIGDIMEALRCFNESAALEPNFAAPYGYIAYINVFFTHAGILSVEEGARICKEASEKAMQLDPMNPWSQLAMAANEFYFEWNLVRTEQALLRAIELNPNMAEAYNLLGWFRMGMQQKDKIDEPLAIAYRLDPLGGETVAGAGQISFLAGKLDAAEFYADEALANDPNNMYAGLVKSMVVGFKGNWKAAISIIEPIYHKAPDFNFAITYLGYAYAKAGEIQKAREFIHLLEEKQKNPKLPPLYHLLFLLYLATGDKEKFYEYYDKSVRGKLVTCLLYYNSPFLSEVSGEERIKHWRREYGFPV